MISIATGGKPHIPFARDCSVFIVIEATVLMMFFMKVEFHSDFINRVAKHVFAVYLFEGALRLGTFQLSDIFYNTVGGALGGVCYWGVMKIRKRL